MGFRFSRGQGYTIESGFIVVKAWAFWRVLALPNLEYLSGFQVFMGF